MYRTTNGGVYLDQHLVQSALRARQQPGRRSAKRQHGVSWPPTRASTLPPEVANCGACPPIAGRPSAPGFPPRPPLLSAPLPPPLPRTCWWRPPMGAASGKRRSGPRARPSPPHPSIPPRYTFANQASIPPAAAIAVTVLNTGSIALAPTSIAITGDFGETDNCVNAVHRSGFQLHHSGHVYAAGHRPAHGPDDHLRQRLRRPAQRRSQRHRNRLPARSRSPRPAISFGQIEEGTVSSPLTITVANSSLVGHSHQQPF